MPSADEIFKKIDANSDGSISKDEFTKSHEAMKARWASRFHHKSPAAQSDAKSDDKKPADKKPEPKKSDDKKPGDKKSETPKSEKPADKQPDKKPADKAEAKAEAATEQVPAVSEAPAVIEIPATAKVKASPARNTVELKASALWDFSSRVTALTLENWGDEARPLTIVGRQFAQALTSGRPPTLVAQLPEPPAPE